MQGLRVLLVLGMMICSVGLATADSQQCSICDQEAAALAAAEAVLAASEAAYEDALDDFLANPNQQTAAALAAAEAVLAASEAAYEDALSAFLDCTNPGGPEEPPAYGTPTLAPPLA